MLSPSLEDYLEEIYRFSKELGFVRTTDIAEKLNVSLPSVTKAVKRLNKKNYLNHEPYKNIKLTQKGKKLGAFLVRRNKTLQEFVEIIGSKSNKADEAEAMEHYLSKDTVSAITSLVEFLKKEPQLQKKLLEFRNKNN
ncbi:metal-dependent transcriptional regulator [Orenia marismortui]|uniref:metal-dependent transcriptional regulator n=1 Tax=Orenia marismortui TaxID=46469 RepID=UPI00035F9BB8|nr:iron dependent repressor, metal binding and dimerization domain protein [Orenia marismortui]